MRRFRYNTTESFDSDHMSFRFVSAPFHEKQNGGAQCALHALNNVVGSATFRADLLAAVDVNHKTEWWGDATITAALAAHPDYEEYEIGREELKTYRAVFDRFAEWPTFLGYVLNRQGVHWVALRKSEHGPLFEWVDSREDRLQMLGLEEAYAKLTAAESGNAHAVFRHVADQFVGFADYRKTLRRGS